MSKNIQPPEPPHLRRDEGRRAEFLARHRGRLGARGRRRLLAKVDYLPLIKDAEIVLRKPKATETEPAPESEAA